MSVDESTGRATISFQPPDAGEPVTVDDDKTGVRAMTEARAIATKYPPSTVHGPHFHAARPVKAKVRPRKAPPGA